MQLTRRGGRLAKHDPVWVNCVHEWHSNRDHTHSVWTLGTPANPLRTVKSPTSKKFGTNVRRHRLALGLTQEALAEKARCHVNYLGGVERGERNCTIEKAAAIAHGLGSDLSELFRGVR
jgi:ribosome-binding protein aMBF1 (putative translation factor)